MGKSLNSKNKYSRGGSKKNTDRSKHWKHGKSSGASTKKDSK